MAIRFRCLLAVAGVLAAAPGMAPAQPPSDADLAADEKLLKEHKVATDGPGLIAFFRQRIPAEADDRRLASLVRQLGDASFPVREQAMADLMRAGPLARQQLREALQDPDLEIQRRARHCLTALERIPESDLAVAAARLLRTRTSAGMNAVLLDYLTTTPDEVLEEEVLQTLLTVSAGQKRVDPLLVQALADAVPARRGAAVLVVACLGGGDPAVVVRKLLSDSHPKVRLRAAQGLTLARQKTGVPILLGLLAEGPRELALQAEEMLTRLAGNSAPRLPLAEDPARRRACAEAWRDWWKANEPRLDMARADLNLSLYHTTARARLVTSEFLSGLLKGNAAILKLVDVPYLDSGRTITTRAELDQHLQQMLNLLGQIDLRNKITFKVHRVASVDEYTRSPDATAEEKQFLASHRRSEVRIVYVATKIEGAEDGTGAAFVRVTGGQARIIGTGQGKPAR